MIFFKVLSALFLLLQKIIQSSAYRTNLCPLRSSSLSNSLSIMLLSNGLNGPPCGIPISVRSNFPFATTPAFRYLCISEITLPSLMVHDSTSMSLLLPCRKTFPNPYRPHIHIHRLHSVGTV